MQHLLHAVHDIAWKTQNNLFWFETVVTMLSTDTTQLVCVHPCYVRWLLHGLHVTTPPSHPKGWFKPWSVNLPKNTKRSFSFHEDIVYVPQLSAMEEPSFEATKWHTKTKLQRVKLQCYHSSQSCCW
jgi:hypothetical protein